MRKYVRSIRVEDASGAQFHIHEYLVRERLFGYVRKRRYFQLDTGERMEQVDPNAFRVVRTGEVLMRSHSR